MKGWPACSRRAVSAPTRSRRAARHLVFPETTTSKAAVPTSRNEPRDGDDGGLGVHARLRFVFSASSWKTPAESHGAVLRGKPAPDMFLTAARCLGVTPSRAAVFEDALVGVEAGRAGGFAVVVRGRD